jgi:hypothetical protein
VSHLRTHVDDHASFVQRELIALDQPRLGWARTVPLNVGAPVPTIGRTVTQYPLQTTNKLAGEIGGWNFFAAACVLARPERCEIADSLRLRFRSQRHDSRGGKREFWRCRAHRSKFAHQAIDNAAGRTTSEDVRQCRALRPCGHQRLPMYARCRGFRAQ